tara:strand:- start:21650 stop:21766 length:117 start_codon:yes stop_codon:yes gene_type:complete
MATEDLGQHAAAVGRSGRAPGSLFPAEVILTSAWMRNI